MSLLLLTPKQRLFADRVAAGSSLTDAYYAAGYRPAKRFTASCLASRLRGHPAVVAHLAAIERRTRHETVVNLRDQAVALARIITLDATNLSRDNRARYARTLKNGDVVIRFPDKLAALKLHSKLLGQLDLDDVSSARHSCELF